MNERRVSLFVGLLSLLLAGVMTFFLISSVTGFTYDGTVGDFGRGVVAAVSCLWSIIGYGLGIYLLREATK